MHTGFPRIRLREYVDDLTLAAFGPKGLVAGRLVRAAEVMLDDLVRKKCHLLSSGLDACLHSTDKVKVAPRE